MVWEPVIAIKMINLIKIALETGIPVFLKNNNTTQPRGAREILT